MPVAWTLGRIRALMTKLPVAWPEARGRCAAAVEGPGPVRAEPPVAEASEAAQASARMAQEWS